MQVHDRHLGLSHSLFFILVTSPPGPWACCFGLALTLASAYLISLSFVFVLIFVLLIPWACCHLILQILAQTMLYCFYLACSLTMEVAPLGSPPLHSSLWLLLIYWSQKWPMAHMAYTSWGPGSNLDQVKCVKQLSLCSTHVFKFSWRTISITIYSTNNCLNLFPPSTFSNSLTSIMTISCHQSISTHIIFIMVCHIPFLF